MRISKYLACLMTVFLISSALSACGKSGNANSDLPVQEAPETAPEAANGGTGNDENSDEENEDSAEIVNAMETIPDLEEARTAAPGQAYLAVTDSNWQTQYWGSATGNGYMLAYDAGIADIHGDDFYTVSVNADTEGFRYSMQDQNYVPAGLGFLAVMIPEGEKLYPGASITIERILVDGNELELSGKNYTFSEDGIETKTNLFNSWASDIPLNARSSEGYLHDEDGDPRDIMKNYSAQVIDPENFESWKKIEVTFSISGTDGSNYQEIVLPTTEPETDAPEEEPEDDENQDQPAEE